MGLTRHFNSGDTEGQPAKPDQQGVPTEEELREQFLADWRALPEYESGGDEAVLRRILQNIGATAMLAERQRLRQSRNQESPESDDYILHQVKMLRAVFGSRSKPQ